MCRSQGVSETQVYAASTSLTAPHYSSQESKAGMQTHGMPLSSAVLSDSPAGPAASREAWHGDAWAQVSAARWLSLTCRKV